MDELSYKKLLIHEVFPEIDTFPYELLSAVAAAVMVPAAA